MIIVLPKHHDDFVKALYNKMVVLMKKWLSQDDPQERVYWFEIYAEARDIYEEFAKQKWTKRN